MELELPSAIQLIQMCGLQPEIAQQFTDIRECGAVFQKYFTDAWKAIEHGNLKRLKELVEIMKKVTASEPSIKGSCLNVCSLQSMTSLCKGEPVMFYMTLLAYTAVMSRTEMVKFLLHAGADTWMGNQLVGTPLVQMFVYCVHHKCSQMIDSEIVKQRLDSSSINAAYHYHIHPTSQQCSMVSTPLELTILLQRMDMVELLLRHGADIFAMPSSNSPSVIFEYFEFGTTKILSWLLDDYLSLNDIPGFIKRVLDADILQESVMELFKTRVKRHPAHAILTCGNQDIVEKFLANYPSQDLLGVEDSNGYTALQVAASQNNLASVKVLLKLMSQKSDEPDLWYAYGGYRQHIVQALLLAARSGYTDIVRCVLHADQSVLDETISGNGNKLWMQAVVEGLANIYKAMCDLDQSHIIELIDENDESTLGHKAAELGDSELFKVVFPLRCLGSSTSHTEGPSMFVMLSMRNKSGLIPLQVAVKKNNLNILRTLQEYAEKQKSKISSESCMERDQWITFWEEWGTKLLLYACSCGSQSSVKLLVEMGCQPDVSFDGETPLSNAAKAGNFETVQYLLDLSSVTAMNNSALLMAAMHGHTRCVKILLAKGAFVNEECPKSSYNCLMKAIENEHRDTVLAILTHSFCALRFSNGTTTSMRMLIKHMPDVAEWVLNKYALVNERDLTQTSNDDNIELEENLPKDSHHKILERHKFELLEDFRPSNDIGDRIEMREFTSDGHGRIGDWMQRKYSTETHPVNLMVELKRENLLNHPLVRTLIRYKWRRVGIPGLFIYYFFYALFLCLLTTYVILLPRPGSNCTNVTSILNISDSDIMTSILNAKFNDSDMTSILNANDSDTSGVIYVFTLYFPRPGPNNCKNMTSISNSNNPNTSGLKKSLNIFFYLSSTITIVYSILYLIFETIQLIQRRKKYLMEIENYVQALMFILILIFVFPVNVAEACWYYSDWRWQVGTLDVFLAWVNTFMLLKEAPIVGQPITMLLNVYTNFVKIIYLPALLVLTFCVPFYMLFFHSAGVFEGGQDTSSLVLTVANPAFAMWSVILQTFGGVNAEPMFEDEDVFYPVLSYSLFTLFIIAMPVLFNNFLIGIAVGETREEREKASILRIKNKVPTSLKLKISFLTN